MFAPNIFGFHSDGIFSLCASKALTDLLKQPPDQPMWTTNTNYTANETNGLIQQEFTVFSHPLMCSLPSRIQNSQIRKDPNREHRCLDRWCGSKEEDMSLSVSDKMCYT